MFEVVSAHVPKFVYSLSKERTSLAQKTPAYHVSFTRFQVKVLLDKNCAQDLHIEPLSVFYQYDMSNGINISEFPHLSYQDYDGDREPTICNLCECHSS